MSAGAPAESWDQWTARLTAELDDLAEGDWLTLTTAPDGVAGEAGTTDAPGPFAARSSAGERRWSLRRRPSSRGVVGGERPTDVFLQARLLEGVLALECISDTEFEGLSDLSEAQEQALVGLGWEQDGHEPAFQRTYPYEPRRSEAGPAGGSEGADGASQAGASAARLLRDSLAQVLGVSSPTDVVLRRSPAKG